MGLPRLNVPEYTTELKGLKKKVRYRPFLLAEEKVLLIARESDENDTMITAVSQILESCLLDDIDVGSLPFFDFENILIRIREVSVGDVIKFNYTHPTCEHTREVNIKTSEIGLENEPPDRRVPIDDTYGVMFTYPTMSQLVENEKLGDENSIDRAVSMFARNMECVYELHGETVWPCTSEEENRKWLHGLSRDQFVRIMGFFDSIPRVAKTVKFDCEKCKEHVELNFKGLTDFFF